jgi:hypothetical protein
MLDGFVWSFCLSVNWFVVFVPLVVHDGSLLFNADGFCSTRLAVLFYGSGNLYSIGSLFLFHGVQIDLCF